MTSLIAAMLEASPGPSGPSAGSALAVWGARRGLDGRDGGGEPGATGQRLEDDAVALGEPAQRGQLFPVGIGLELEQEPDGREPDRCLAVHPEGAAEVQV